MQIYSLYICEKVIRIEEKISCALRFCRNYIIKEPAPDPDYTIEITEEDIENQRKLTGDYWINQLASFVLARKISDIFLRDARTLLFHGCTVVINGASFMFSAPSGTGKTTHSLLWTKYIPDAYILNGDKPFVSTGTKIIAWGSPWCGSERYNRNEGVELKAICFLERAEKNRILEISDEEALPMLARQTGDPNPSDYRTKIWIIEGLNRLRGRVKFYRYEMNNLEEEDAFHTTYDVLSKL